VAEVTNRVGDTAAFRRCHPNKRYRPPTGVTFRAFATARNFPKLGDRQGLYDLRQRVQDAAML
jgi:hypothetical protein